MLNAGQEAIKEVRMEAIASTGAQVPVWFFFRHQLFEAYMSMRGASLPLRAGERRSTKFLAVVPRGTPYIDFTCPGCPGMLPLRVSTETPKVSTEAPRQESSPSFRVSGTIVDKNKSPVNGIKVMIAEASDKGFLFGTVALNTKALTDAKGEFSIDVEKSIFQNRQEFVILADDPADSVLNMDRLAVRQSGGGMAVVKIDPATREYKLGEIVQEPDPRPAVQLGERRFRFSLTSISFIRVDGSVLTTPTGP
jgi:hypothetical protein